jgi:hypothetical protein
MKNYDLLIIILAVIVLFALMVLTADASDNGRGPAPPLFDDGIVAGTVDAGDVRKRAPKIIGTVTTDSRLTRPPLVVATFVSPSPSPTIGATETRWPFDG